MAVRLILRSSQIRELETLRNLGPKGIELITGSVRNLAPHPLRPAELRRAIAKAVGDPAGTESIVAQLLSLQALIRQRSLSVAEVLDGLDYGLDHVDAAERWNDEDIRAWKAMRPQLESLLALSEIATVAKALDLSYEYANLFQSARIITDARPVYNKEASDIEGVVVSFILRVYYDSVDGSHTLSIAIDEKDIELLRGQCERALTKSRTARRVIEQIGKPIIIVGADEDESD